MITEVQIEGSPKVIAPKFHCDNELGNIPEPLPNKAFAAAIVGNAGSGKTSLLMSLLTARQPNRVYRGVFEDVYFVIPPHSRASLASTIFEDHPPEKIFDDLTPEVLTTILSRCQEAAEEDCNSLIVIDDCTVSIKDKEVEKLLRRIIFNRRHYHISMFILSQTYNSIPLSLRKTLSHFFAFKPANRKEIENIFSELIFQPKSVADEILEYTYKNKRDFLFGDASTGKLYRNFNLLKINGEE
jgi:hypothetical protein